MHEPLSNARAVQPSPGCPTGKDHEPLTTVRRIFWTDVMDSYLYVTQGAKEYPETLVTFTGVKTEYAWGRHFLPEKIEKRHRYWSLSSLDCTP
jgi:hypothetical protein